MLGKDRNKIRTLIVVVFFTLFYERGKKTKMHTISGIVLLEASAAACQEDLSSELLSVFDENI